LKINKGCQVEVVSFGRSSSQKLKEIADDFIDLDQDVKRYCIGQRRRRAPQKTQNQDQGQKQEQKKDREQAPERAPQKQNEKSQKQETPRKEGTKPRKKVEALVDEKADQ